MMSAVSKDKKTPGGDLGRIIFVYVEKFIMLAHKNFALYHILSDFFFSLIYLFDTAFN